MNFWRAGQSNFASRTSRTVDQRLPRHCRCVALLLSVLPPCFPRPPWEASAARNAVLIGATCLSSCSGTCPATTRPWSRAGSVRATEAPAAKRRVALIEHPACASLHCPARHVLAAIAHGALNPLAKFLVHCAQTSARPVAVLRLPRSGRAASYFVAECSLTVGHGRAG
jgi:hypothetical protein